MGLVRRRSSRWKKVYGGLMPSEVRRLKQLEEENSRLRRLVADLTLDKEMLTEVIKKGLTPVRGREMIDFVRAAFQVSIRRACRAVPAPRSSYPYTSVRPPQDVLRKRIRKLAVTHVRYGYRRIHVLLKRDGWHVNLKRVRRL